MQLFHPKSEVKFRASPAFFLGPFNIYDREESLGVELDGFDPNDLGHLRQLLDEYFFPRWMPEYGYTMDHKLALVEELLASLRNPNYDFLVLFQNNDEEGFYLPGNWEIRNARLFFVGAYEAIECHWGSDLRETGYLLPAVADLQ